MIFLLLFASFGQNLPDAPGKDAVLSTCQDCHELDVVTADNMTREAWKKGLKAPISNSRPLSNI
jgi:hypothetical protein